MFKYRILSAILVVFSLLTLAGCKDKTEDAYIRSIIPLCEEKDSYACVGRGVDDDDYYIINQDETEEGRRLARIAYKKNNHKAYLINSFFEEYINSKSEYENLLKRLKNLRLSDRYRYDNFGYGNYVKQSLAWKAEPNYELLDRARSLTTDMLENGDVILLNIETEKEIDGDIEIESTTLAYIYFRDEAGGALYRYRYDSSRSETKNGEFLVTKGTELIDFLRDLVGKSYIIIRPYVD